MISPRPIRRSSGGGRSRRAGPGSGRPARRLRTGSRRARTRRTVGSGTALALVQEVHMMSPRAKTASERPNINQVSRPRSTRRADETGPPPPRRRKLWTLVGERVARSVGPVMSGTAWPTSRRPRPKATKGRPNRACRDLGHAEEPSNCRLDGRNDRSGRRHRPRPPQGLRSRARDRLLRDVLGFEVMQRYGDEAAFLSAGGYHHHIGLNTWESEGGSRRRPGRPGSSTSRSAIRPGRRWPSARRLVDAGVALTAPPTTASARRSTCATPTRTASSCTATARGRSGPTRCTRRRSTSPRC